MRTNLFYTNTFQLDSPYWVSVDKFTRSYGVNEFNHRLDLTLPQLVLNSTDPIEPITVDYSDDIESQLYGPNDLSMVDTFEYLQFYNRIEDDLTIFTPSFSSREVAFEFSNYLELIINNPEGNYRIEIGLFYLLGRYNYFIDDKFNVFNNLIIKPKYNTNKIINLEILKRDYTTEILEIENTLATEIESGTMDGITLENLPQGQVLINLYINNSIVSSTTTQVGVQHVPLSIFGQNESTLATVAQGLYSLESFRSIDYPQLISSYSRGLVNMLQPGQLLLYSNVDVSNQINIEDSSYSVYDNAFVLYTLIYNFYKQPNASKELNEFISRLLPILISTFNLRTRLCIRDIDSNSNAPSSTSDISTTILVLFIIEYLILLNYDSKLEYLAILMNSKLKEIIGNLDSVFYRLPNENAEIIYHLYLYCKYKNIEVDLYQHLPENLSTLTLTNKLRLCYMHSVDNIAIPTEINYITYLDQHPEDSTLWGIEGSYNLEYTSWVHIITTKKPLWLDVTLQDRLDQVTSFMTYIYRQGLKTLPYNRSWFSYSKVIDPSTNIGSIYKSFIECLTPLALEYTCLANSSNIDTAYGIGLNKWGNTVSVSRLPNELDDEYRLRLKARMQLNLGTRREIETYINILKKDERTRYIEILPKELYINDEIVPWNSIDDLLVAAEEYNNEGVMTIDGFYPFTNLGVLFIETYEDDRINNMFKSLNSLNITTKLLPVVEFSIINNETYTLEVLQSI